ERLGQEPVRTVGYIECLLDLLGVPRQRLLAEDVLACFERPDRPLAVQRVRERDVDRLDVGILEQRLVAPVRTLDVPFLRVGLGPTLLAARDGDQRRPVRRTEPRDELPVDVGRGDDSPPDGFGHTLTIAECRKSALACWATRSWARPIQTR